MYRLKKALYGLKQAPRTWYDMLTKFLLSQKFSKCDVDPTLFTRKEVKDILMAKPTKKHLHAIKQAFRYLRGTLNMGLWYSKDTSIALTAYADADHAGCQDTRRSTFGSVQLLGDKLVTWFWIDFYGGEEDERELLKMGEVGVVLFDGGEGGNRYHQKDKVKAKPDKIEHEMESVEKSKVNPVKVKVKNGAEYTELLEPIPESHQVPWNDNIVIFEVTSVEQSGKTVEQHLANFEETHALSDLLYQHLAIEVEKVNTSLISKAYFDILRKKVEMSRDVLTVGSTMRIPLLYRGEYSQWVERFMNYIEEQTDGEAMINSIKNCDQPLPRVTQVSIAGTTSTEQPPLKDKSMWSDQEKRV
nr:uncharacterized mitochondrial protein AtMg00810-like [Tanacetum cinerariifolium]